MLYLSIGGIELKIGAFNLFTVLEGGLPYKIGGKSDFFGTLILLFLVG